MAGTVLRSGTISTTLGHIQPSDDSITIESQQDVQDIIDLNKFEYNSIDERARWTRRGKDGMDVPIARIPMVVYMELIRKGILDHKGTGDAKTFNAWLNDPDNRFFRTRPGHIG